MRLHSIRLVNYRCFRDITVDLKHQFNVVAGKNGSGKTSLLKGISESLKALGHILKYDTEALDDTGDVKLNVVEYGRRARFERQYPVSIHAQAAMSGGDISWSISRSSETEEVSFRGQDPSGFFKAPSSDTSVSAATLPIVAFYRANRYWKSAQADEIQAATAREARQDAYAEWSNASIDSSLFQRWLVTKSIERMQFVSESGNEHHSASEDELSLVNAVVRDAVEGASELRYDFRQKSLLVEWLPTRQPMEHVRLWV